MKPNLEKRINEVAKELQKGTRTKDIISLFCRMWGLGDRTVKLYVAKARERASENVKIENEYTLEIRRKSTALDTHIYLSQANKRLLAIIKGKYKVEEKCYDKESGKIIVYDRKPNAIEVIEAIKEYNRLNSIYDRS